MSEQTKRPTTLELSGTMPDIAHSRNCMCDPCRNERWSAVETPAPQEPTEPRRRGYTLQSLSNYFGWGVREDRDIWQFACQREGLLRLCQSLLRTDKSTASTAELAIRERIDHLDAVEAENTRLRAALVRIVERSSCMAADCEQLGMYCSGCIARAALKGDPTV